MMRATLGLVLVLFSGPVLAQESNDREPSIQVVGAATVSTPPDLAHVTYWVRGEGKTADEASAALASKHAGIVSGLAGLLGADAQLSSGDVIVIETRSPQCDGPGVPNHRPRLSDGPCEITGYMARLQGTVRTAAVDKAGTAAGLAARLGASDARVQGFQLSDPAEAQQRASAAAIVNARARAEAMAAGARVRLGELISLNDQNLGSEIVVRGGSARSLASSPPPNDPPIEISVSPKAIETHARVVARYSIAR